MLLVQNLLFLLTAMFLVISTRSAPPGLRNSKNQAKLIQALNPAENLFEKNGKLDEKAKEYVQVPKPKITKKRPELVRRPDHLEAVPLERDGHLNKLFRQEVFLGKDSNKLPVWPDGELGGVESVNDVHRRSVTTEKDKDPETLLAEVFHKADTDNDTHVSLRELEEWIYQTALHHLDEAVSDTKRIYFQQIDANSDNVLTWEEYHFHFLTDNNLMDPYRAKNHKEEDHADLEIDVQDKIELELQKWKEADVDGDGGLTETEFLAFRHPEHNLRTLKTMVKDIIKTLDKDKDGQLAKKEFASPPVGKVDSKWQEEEKSYLKEREKEFENEIDLNKDGRVTEDELLQYSNPRNPQHARHEARELLDLADTDKDKKLSLDEVMAHKSLFFGSSLMDPSKNLHDEF